MDRFRNKSGSNKKKFVFVHSVNKYESFIFPFPCELLWIQGVWKEQYAIAWELQ